MNALYAKSKLGFALAWIGIYCVVQSLAFQLNELIGVEYSANAVFCILMTIVIFLFLRRNNLWTMYGLCRTPVPAHRMLYYIPLVILATGSLWHGVALNESPAGAACRVAAMVCVGFLEEIIFRGFLFKALLRDGTRSAVIISSVTFGVGHLVNLVNGSGMDLVSNLCQVAYAVVVGFMLVTIFWRSGSLIPCIAVHSAINSLSTFSNDAGASSALQIIHALVLMAVAGAYAIYLNKVLAHSTLGAAEEPPAAGTAG